MNRAVLLQLKKTVKQVEDGSAVAIGKKVTPGNFKRIYN